MYEKQRTQIDMPAWTPPRLHTYHRLYRLGYAIGARVMLRIDTARWRLCHRNGVLSTQQFSLDSESYSYTIHPYNHTWRNERAVELPVVRRFLERRQGTLLEIGNVLVHYGVRGHPVIDRYEPSPLPTLRNIDVIELNERERYDSIVSISTLEHVGFDERPREPGKLPQVLTKIQRLLAPGGTALVTIPTGYNPHLDALLRSARSAFDRVQCLERISARNEWRECSLSAALQRHYGRPFLNANAIVFGTINSTQS